jgi:hypothetical protein
MIVLIAGLSPFAEKKRLLEADVSLLFKKFQVFINFVIHSGLQNKVKWYSTHRNYSKLFLGVYFDKVSFMSVATAANAIQRQILPNFKICYHKGP